MTTILTSPRAIGVAGATALTLVVLIQGALALEVPLLRARVNDYAGMIQSSTKSKLEEALRGFEQSDSTQIVILTIPSLEGDSIEEFGIRAAERWKIGHQGKDNGVLLIVSKQERKIRIEVGRGLEGKLTDLMAGRIIDQVITPKFKQSDFDGGFIAGVSALISATRGEFKAGPKSVSRKQRNFPPFLTFLLFLGIFILILLEAFPVSSEESLGRLGFLPLSISLFRLSG